MCAKNKFIKIKKGFKTLLYNIDEISNLQINGTIVSFVFHGKRITMKFASTLLAIDTYAKIIDRLGGKKDLYIPPKEEKQDYIYPELKEIKIEIIIPKKQNND